VAASHRDQRVPDEAALEPPSSGELDRGAASPFDETGHRVAEPEEARASAEEAIDRSQTRRLVRAAIARLPENYRTILLLRDIEELSTAEAAALLGLSENAVKIRLHRARQALRSLIIQQGGIPQS
jgi:RNA polymerase sigma factor (sigma-70 family)